MLFEVADLDESDGFLSEMLASLEAARPKLQVVPFSFHPSERDGHGEALSGGELFSLGDIPIEPLSMTVIQAADAFRKSSEFESTRFLCLKMLNRMDFSGTFRFLEREILFQHGTTYALQTLLRLGPSLMVFRVTPHEFLPFLLWRVADFLGIEVLHFQPCSVAPVMFPVLSSGEKVNFESVGARGTKIADFIQACSNQTLNSLAEKNLPEYMKMQVARDVGLTSIRSRIRAFRHSLRWLHVDRFRGGVDFSGHAKRDSVLTRLAKIILTRSLVLSLRSKILRQASPPGRRSPFVLFALHYEPERTSLPDGLPVDHQADAVLEIRAIVPPGVKLLVKEHYSQQSSALRGFLGRSPMFYDLVERFPNTEFAAFAADSVQLVQDAECVVTLTGTVGIEAVLVGKPVIYFGTPWWAGVPGSVRRGELNDFADLSKISVPERRVVLDFLRNQILDRGVPGLGSESIATMEERYGKLPRDFRKVEAQAIAQCIALCLKM